MITIDSNVKAARAMDAIFAVLADLDSSSDGIERIRVKSNGSQVFVSALIEVTTEQIQTINDVVAGLGAWTLTNDASAVDAPVTVSGMNAAYDFTITLDGETVSSGEDTASPWTLTFTPVLAGTYRVSVTEKNGYKTGLIEIEVS